MNDVFLSCRIYVVENAPNSQRALQNLTTFCRTYLPDKHKIEIVDVFAHPERALAERVLLTPTLVIDLPLPARRIVGDLSDGKLLRQALNIDTRGPDARASTDA